MLVSPPSNGPPSSLLKKNRSGIAASTGTITGFQGFLSLLKYRCTVLTGVVTAPRRMEYFAAFVAIYTVPDRFRERPTACRAVAWLRSCRISQGGAGFGKRPHPDLSEALFSPLEPGLDRQSSECSAMRDRPEQAGQKHPNRQPTPGRRGDRTGRFLSLSL